MKRLLLAFALFAGGAAHAQITSEQNYDAKILGGKLSTGEVKFAGFFALTATTGQVRIYNNDYSLYKQVGVTLPSGYKVENMTYLSDKLFNINSAVEVVLNIFDPQSGNQAVRIVDENGAVLLARDAYSYPSIYNTPNGTKMVLYSSVDNKSTIYALGGMLLASAVPSQGKVAEALPYPNPTTSDIKLPYTVSPGKVEELVVRAATGQQVRSYQVDGKFDHVLFSTQDLAPGVYFYTVGNGLARRFTVQ